ncbi:MAG: M20 aminoacylase family protein [Paracoccaceae bacterium]
MPVINRIAEFHDDMKTWRRYLHQHPELQYELPETLSFVTERLREFGVDQIVERIGRSGIVATIKGNGGDGPTVGLRADMDALPIQEVRDLPYKSKHEGKMHACGHDGHTTMLLGAARYLAETRNFSGSVALIFQPAEEGGAGARAMCDDGLMERFGISRVFAMHNKPGTPAGSFQMCRGPIMAAADTFSITVKGQGSHAAFPHESVDPVIVAVQIVQGLQTLVSRNTDPLKSLVVSVTQIHAGTTDNVIAETAMLGGTVRSFDAGLRAAVPDLMRRVVNNTAAAFGAGAEIDYVPGYPATVNDDAEMEFAASVATSVAGKEMVDVEHAPEMGAEDFSFMLEERPGAYVYLGQGEGAGWHHPEFDFNDEVSPVGASYFVRLVEEGQPARA